ncbi:YigZ family protein [bacterium]|nr:YigZ family protein [candidate division CSSED10-310 bacterium]
MNRTKPVKTIEGDAFYEETIRKSRFLAWATRIDSVDAAAAFLDSARRPDASHNCWAYRFGPVYRFSDDGEPGGTAGRPIYMAIDSQEMDCIAVMVTRYFGGIKLGVGGLARAYGGVAARCLGSAVILIIREQITCDIAVPFDRTGPMYTVLDHFVDVQRLDESYSPSGHHFRLQIDADRFDSFRCAVIEATAGRATIEILPQDPDAPITIPP